MLQEPVQVKTDVQLVVMSSESSINEARAAFFVTASAVGPVRGVLPPTPQQKAPQPADCSSERCVGIIVVIKANTYSTCCSACRRLVQYLNTKLLDLPSSAWLWFRCFLPASI